MAAGAALSKNWTYAKVEDLSRLRADVIDATAISPALALDVISLAVQKTASILNAATAPWYTKSVTYKLTGSGNPYLVDLTTDASSAAVNPFPDTLKRAVYLTGGSTRADIIKLLSFEEAEKMMTQTSYYTGSYFGAHAGDQLLLYIGSGVTVNTTNDRVEVYFYRQPIVNSVTRASYVDVPDKHVSLVVDMVTGNFLEYKNKGMVDPTRQQKIDGDIRSIYQEYQIQSQTDKSATPLTK